MKNKIRQTAIGAIALSLFVAQSASANTGGESFFSATGIFNFFLLVCAVMCLVWGLKVLSLVRGGLMSRSWQMFVLGFAALVLAQVFVVSHKAHILPIPEFVATMLYLVMGGTWLVGLFQIRKILG
jgi:hypothetical protein